MTELSMLTARAATGIYQFRGESTEPLFVIMSDDQELR